MFTTWNFWTGFGIGIVLPFIAAFVAVRGWTYKDWRRFRKHRTAITAALMAENPRMAYELAPGWWCEKDNPYRMIEALTDGLLHDKIQELARKIQNYITLDT